jgi:hypothetical protein
MTSSRSDAQSSAGEARADVHLSTEGPLRLTDVYDLPTRSNGAALVGRYDWPYHDFGNDYPNLRARYRDYRLDYGDFASEYSGFAPRYRDFARDYGEFAFDYQPKPSTGRPLTPAGQVIIDVLPTAAAIFVDGQMIGVSYELSAGFMLDAGPRRIEVRADDYEPVVLEVMIAPGRVMKFEGTLRLRQAPEPQSQPARVETDPQPQPARVEAAPAPMTIYFIPRCYLGNVPPVAARLPAGCSMSDLKLFPR